MQARVEPQFLFNTLAQVKTLYMADPERGERMLDELIAYLRAAMPKMRDTASTAGQELDLARAYLNIVCLRLGERFAFTIDISSEAAAVRMPPMLVLPLLDHAIEHGYANACTGGRLAIRCCLNDQTLSLRFVDTAASYLPEHETVSLHGLHERLAALFGKHAVLELARTGSGGTQALLDIPAVAVPSPPTPTP